MIWLKPDNGFVVWNITDGGQNNASSPVFGPLSDAAGTWLPHKLGVGGDGLTRLLLRRSDGAVAVWTLGANLTFGSSTPAYGPYSGSTCVDMAVARDGSVRLLWTTSSGTFGLWNIALNGTVSCSPVTFGPLSDASGTWSASKIAVGSDGLCRLLLKRSDGQGAVWTMDSAMNFASSSGAFGPYTGLSVASLVLNTASTSDNKRHLMWVYGANTIALWRLSPNDALTIPSALEVNASYGPYWTPQALGVGGDNQMRVLWTNPDGRANFWKLSPSPDSTAASIVVNAIFGPLPQPTPTPTAPPTPTPTATPTATATPAPLPLLSVANASVSEGNSGTTPLPLVVSLSSASSQNVTFSYAMVAGTATSGVDYVSASGNVTIPAGQTSSTVSVSVNGDTAVEPDETLTLTLSNILGARLTSGTTISATGTIVNDDVAPTPIPTPTVMPVTNFQPDVVLGQPQNEQTVEEVGENIFNDDTRQTLRAVVVLGQAQNYRVRIKNIGSVPTAFQVRMTAPLTGNATGDGTWNPAGWSASSTVEGQTTEIAPLLRSPDGWTTPTLVPGDGITVRLSLSSPTSSIDGSFRISAQNGTASDAVVGNLCVQGVGKIQWSRDGDTWQDATTTAIQIDQFGVIGLRVQKSRPDLDWPVTAPFGPLWTFQGETLDGDVVWFQGTNIIDADKVTMTWAGSSTQVPIKVVAGSASN